FRYHSFKELDIRGKVPFFVLVVIMLVFAIILWEPPLILFLVSISYAVSGPVLTLIYLRQRREERKRGQMSESDRDEGDKS
ncbi:MAG: CDP-diacylglycerol--serine O-phosphatidyltransferase, partial [Gammaproteobacteria bacterium]|nr:CDP-diacylglycerol--serine O-phosphatidyltransferase [Gammaproteobacteria bacterium]